MERGVLRGVLDFEIVLKGVGGIDVGGRDGGLESFSIGLHGNGFPSFALIYVPVIEAHGLRRFVEG